MPHLTVPPGIAIALVEDEDVLREELSFQLGHLGFSVEAFESAEQLYRRMAVRRFSAIVLDIGLAGEDGLSVCRHLREHDKHVGIVFVTARALRDDRLVGLLAGADAYLTKPVDIDELSILLRRLSERAAEHRRRATDKAATASDGRTWRLEGNGDFLVAPDHSRVRLSANETRLLKMLLDKQGEPATPPELAHALGLLPDEYDKHRVEVIVSRLRDKVLRETGIALPLQTRRGLGYSFRPEV